ncbi:signal peptidase I [Vibrio tritonius]|uniref:Signal peptidase I n=1 Tax=Vibrio tritonius TaxID=1435069 RepID=A0ABS7YJZ5_9VIBR|nr:signal peptidase I [Vibrio tritonius]MCA2015976.1 signal peptidase I [Vibrio tritonius]
MANTFSLFLVILTLVTGVVWVLEKLVWAKKRQQKLTDLQTETNGIDPELSKKIDPQPWWVENAVSIFPVIAFVLILRSFIFEPFQIPSGSMMPTLLVGDFIVVEKYAYGLKDPVWHKTLIPTSEPKRGDIVVFRYPKNPSIDYIKRVVGLPGDTIRYSSLKQICIQAKGTSECKPVPLTNLHESDFAQGYTQLMQLDEQLGEVKHQILINPMQADRVSAYEPRAGVNEWVVPEGHYFMMGDNRDNSADSRFWGFVPEKNLVGKAVGIWISFVFDRSPDSALPTWVPTGVRFNRIGGIN